MFLCLFYWINCLLWHMTLDHLNKGLCGIPDKQGANRYQVNRASKTECERPSSDPCIGGSPADIQSHMPKKSVNPL